MSRRGENIFKRKDGRWEGRYISEYTNNGKAKYLSVYAITYAECAEKLKQAKLKLLQKCVSITVNELFNYWLENKKSSIKSSTYVNYRRMFETHISKTFGDIRAERITAFMINNYVNVLLENGRINGEGLSPKTVQSILILLKSIFSYGEREFKIDNPAKYISLPKYSSKEIIVFTHEEMDKIRMSALYSGYHELGILLSLYTGLRIGELCALKWNDIDLQEQVIHVKKTLQRIINPYSEEPKTIVVITAPKSAKSVRDIPIPTFILPRLTNIKLTIDPQCYFLTGKNTYTETRTYLYRYETFLKRIGIPYKNFHVLRHTFATECIRLGIDVKTVSELLGHSSVKITLDRYVHSDMNMKRKQLEKLYALV